jgi:hypothetical protein
MPEPQLIVDKRYPLWRKGDPTKKPELFSWDSPRLKRAMAAFNRQKAVGDSSSLGPLLSNEAMTELYQQTARKFPLLEMIEKSEANGATDTYMRQIAFSQFDANTPLSVAENGVFVEDRSNFVEDFTPIALFGAIGGASMKSVFASRASGGPDVVDNEVNDRLTKLAQDVQSEAFRMQRSGGASGAGAYTQKGVWDPTGFDGLRFITETRSPGRNIITIDTTAGGYVPANFAISHAIQDINQRVRNAGGETDLIIGPGEGSTYIEREWESKPNYVPTSVEVIPGLQLGGVRMGDGRVVPYYPMAGDLTTGYYSLPGVTGTFIDIFVVDSRGLAFKWLGSEGPVAVDIAPFTDRTARILKAVYWFVSLQVPLPYYIGKVRLKISGTPADQYAAALAA